MKYSALWPLPPPVAGAFVSGASALERGNNCITRLSPFSPALAGTRFSTRLVPAKGLTSQNLFYGGLSNARTD